MNLPQAYWVRASNGSFGFKLKEEFLGVVLTGGGAEAESKFGGGLAVEGCFPGSVDLTSTAPFRLQRPPNHANHMLIMSTTR